MKIRLLKNNDNTYTQIKSEPQSDDDTDLSASPLAVSKTNLKYSATPENVSSPSPDPSKTSDGSTAPGGYVYWPNAGVFIHPVALQQQLLMYQRMSNNNSYILPNSQGSKSPTAVQNSIPKDTGAQEMRKLVPKVVKPKPIYSKRESLGY